MRLVARNDSKVIDALHSCQLTDLSKLGFLRVFRGDRIDPFGDQDRGVDLIKQISLI